MNCFVRKITVNFNFMDGVPSLASHFPVVLKQNNWKTITQNPASNKVLKTIKVNPLTHPDIALEDMNYMNKEIQNTQKAAKLGVAPTVRGTYSIPAGGTASDYGFMQDYGGRTLGHHMSEGNLTPKQSYYLGKQTGRMRRRLATQGGFVPTDIHADNLVISNHYRDKPVAQMIDLEMTLPTESYNPVMHDKATQPLLHGQPTRMASPFLRGYNMHSNLK